jgi:hypothetical protein
MLPARSPDDLFDVVLLPFPGIELPYTDFEGCPKLGKAIDAFEHFPPKLLLRRLRKLGRLGDRYFKCPDHAAIIAGSLRQAR